MAGTSAPRRARNCRHRAITRWKIRRHPDRFLTSARCRRRFSRSRETSLRCSRPVAIALATSRNKAQARFPPRRCIEFRVAGDIELRQRGGAFNRFARRGKQRQRGRRRWFGAGGCGEKLAAFFVSIPAAIYAARIPTAADIVRRRRQRSLDQKMAVVARFGQQMREKTPVLRHDVKMKNVLVDETKIADVFAGAFGRDFPQNFERPQSALVGLQSGRRRFEFQFRDVAAPREIDQRLDAVFVADAQGGIAAVRYQNCGTKRRRREYSRALAARSKRKKVHNFRRNKMCFRLAVYDERAALSSTAPPSMIAFEA